MKTFILILSLMLAPYYAWSTDAGDGRITSTPLSGGTNNNATQSRDNNQAGSMIASVMSMGFSIAGATQAAKCPTSPSACAKAAVLFGMSMVASMQSSANAKTAGLANATGTATDGYGFGNSNYSPGNKANLGKLMGGDLPKAESINKAVTTTGINGVKVNPKTGAISIPGGKTYNASDFTSPAAMKAAGFSEQDVNGAFDKVQRLNEEASKKVSSVAAAGGFDEGGGGAMTPQTQSGSQTGSTMDSFENGTQQAERRPASVVGVAGLSKNYNGDQIGVSEDDIFKMMNRRYLLKEKQSTFVNEETSVQK